MRKFKISIVKILFFGIAMLMLGNGSLLAQITVTLPSVTGSSGSTAVQPITVSNITVADNVTAFQFIVYYDKNIVYITNATASGLTAGSEPTVNPDTANGRILVAWARASAITGSGTLLNLHFTLRNTGTSNLTFINPNTLLNTFLFNAGTPANTPVDGSVTVPAISIDVQDVSGFVGETILIPIHTTALTIANNILSYNFTATYDQTIINILPDPNGYSLTGTLSAGGFASINPDNTNGTVNFALAKATPIVGGPDVLVYLRAQVVGKGVANVAIPAFQFNAGLPAATTFPGTVTVTNQTPSINAIPDQSGAEGTLLTFNVSGSDPDGDALTYSAANLPSGATFVGQAFSWTPGFAQSGDYVVTFTVNDGDGGTASADANISIANTNRAPTVALVPPSPYSVNEGALLAFNVVGTDADVGVDGDVLTYSAAPLPAGANLNANTGAFSWTPSFAQSGTYNITFTVTDSHGASADAAAAITVINVNGPPSFTVPGAQQLSSASVREGQLFTFQYIAIDPEGDPVSYFKVDPSPAASTINTNTGLFSWTPPLGSAGTYQIAVLASDGVNTTASALGTLTVLPNAAPVLTITPPGTTKTVAELGSLAFGVTATDADAGDVVTITHTALPTGAAFTGGIFSWTPALGQEGTYTVTFTGTDLSNATDVVTVTINVTKTNLAPVFDNNLGDMTVTVGDVITFDFDATDPNGDPITFSLVAPVPPGASIDAATGELTWTTQAPSTTTYTLTVRVTDGSLFDEVSSDVTVVVPLFGITGTVTYNNTANTPLINVEVTLTKPDNSTATATTDANGNYSFTGLVDGNYTIAFAKTTGWGGVNSADALEVSRHFAGFITLDALSQIAGDVNESSQANNADALLIVQRYVGLISSFTRADWVFSVNNEPVPIAGANVVLDVKGQATGDANKSLVPTLLAKSVSVELVVSKSINIKPSEAFEIPVKAASSIEAGAVSLKLSYNTELAKFVNAKFNGDFLVKEKDGVISIAWADLSGGKNPLVIKEGSLLGTITLRANDNLAKNSKIGFELVDGEMVDAQGSVSKSNLIIAEGVYSVPAEFSLSQNYPNPFNPTTTINYELPVSGYVTLTIYNIVGQEVAQVVDGVQEAGSYRAEWNASKMASGVYIYKLSVTGAAKEFSSIKRMILMK
jgi:hypothetical protein